MTIKKPTLGKHCNESDTTNQTSSYNGRQDEYDDDANVNTRTHTQTKNSEMRKKKTPVPFHVQSFLNGIKCCNANKMKLPSITHGFILK